VFLVLDSDAGPSGLVFTRADPRLSGYVGAVTAGVSLLFDPSPPGPPIGEADRPGDYVLAAAPDDALTFVVFRTARAAVAAGYPVCGRGIPEVHHDWRHYADRKAGPAHEPPVPRRTKGRRPAQTVRPGCPATA
jgi:hypothetical protein